MIIHIHDNSLVSDLQERFSKCFQYLKIEFYHKPHRGRTHYSENDKIDAGTRIGDIRHKHNNGEIQIKSWYTPEMVEKEFKNKFGLNVQIFRKENGAWVQTLGTDTYNLLQQSEMSKHAEISIIPKFKEQLGEYDYL